MERLACCYRRELKPECEAQCGTTESRIKYNFQQFLKVWVFTEISLADNQEAALRSILHKGGSITIAIHVVKSWHVKAAGGVKWRAYYNIQSKWYKEVFKEKLWKISRKPGGLLVKRTFKKLENLVHWMQNKVMRGGSRLLYNCFYVRIFLCLCSQCKQLSDKLPQSSDYGA